MNMHAGVSASFRSAACGHRQTSLHSVSVRTAVSHSGHRGYSTPDCCRSTPYHKDSQRGPCCAHRRHGRRARRDNCNSNVCLRAHLGRPEASRRSVACTNEFHTYKYPPLLDIAFDMHEANLNSRGLLQGTTKLLQMKPSHHQKPSWKLLQRPQVTQTQSSWLLQQQKKLPHPGTPGRQAKKPQPHETLSMPRKT